MQDSTLQGASSLPSLLVALRPAPSPLDAMVQWSPCAGASTCSAQAAACTPFQAVSVSLPGGHLSVLQDSLFHSSNRSSAGTVLWNLRFSCTLRCQAHLLVQRKWIDETLQMLADKHPRYTNPFLYRYDFNRLVFVTAVSKEGPPTLRNEQHLSLSLLYSSGLSDLQRPSATSSHEHRATPSCAQTVSFLLMDVLACDVYSLQVFLRMSSIDRHTVRCDMCLQKIRFPLLVPCRMLHLLCSSCLFPNFLAESVRHGCCM